MAVASVVSDSRLPAYLRLRDAVAARIAAGEWSADNALPSENRLARDHGLSVGTVRKALQELVDENLLERRQGSGTFLRKPAFDSTLFRFFQVREPGAAQSIPSSRLISRACVRAPDDVALLLETADVIQVDRIRYFADQPLLSERIYIPQARFAGFEAIPETEIGPLLYPVYFERYGILVARAEDEVSFGTASKRTARALEVGVGHPVAIIERTAFTPDGRAIEWRVARGRADHFRYRSRID